MQELSQEFSPFTKPSNVTITKIVTPTAISDPYILPQCPRESKNFFKKFFQEKNTNKNSQKNFLTFCGGRSIIFRPDRGVSAPTRFYLLLAFCLQVFIICACFPSIAHTIHNRLKYNFVLTINAAKSIPTRNY